MWTENFDLQRWLARCAVFAKFLMRPHIRQYLANCTVSVRCLDRADHAVGEPT